MRCAMDESGGEPVEEGGASGGPPPSRSMPECLRTQQALRTRQGLLFPRALFDSEDAAMEDEVRRFCGPLARRLPFPFPPVPRSL